MTNTINYLIEEYNANKQSLRDRFGEEYFEDLFSRYENLNMIYLIGYTPSFNDGDPCTHISINTLTLDESQEAIDCYELGIADVFPNILEKDEVKNHELFKEIETAYEDREYDDIFGHWKAKEDTELVKVFKEHFANGSLKEEELREIGAELGSVSDIIEIVYGTDFKILVKRDPETKLPVVSVDRYDCGY